MIAIAGTRQPWLYNVYALETLLHAVAYKEIENQAYPQQAAIDLRVGSLLRRYHQKYILTVLGIIKLDLYNANAIVVK